MRRAQASDLELLVRHRESMWLDMHGYSARQIRAAAARSRAWIRREFRSGRYIAFVAEGPGGRVAGSGAIWLRSSQPYPGPRPRPDAPYVMSMYTERASRRSGVATRLVREMIRWARRKGYRRITLHASAQGAPVYRRIGFEDSNEMRFNLVRLGKDRPASRAPGRPIRSGRGRA